MTTDSAATLIDWLRSRGVRIVEAAGTRGRFRLDAAERLAPAERRLIRAFLKRHRRAVLAAAEIATLPPPEDRARLRFPPGLTVSTALGERGTVERVEGRTVCVRLQSGHLRRLDYTDLFRLGSPANR